MTSRSRFLMTMTASSVDDQIGEIAIRGDVVMKGYWNKAEATAEAFKNGWYHTGDLGKRDADGYIYLLDRKKELIISGGANIYPREVEEVLLLHPGVLEVAVIGFPDRLWGESVMAVVRPRAGANPTEAELVELCRSHLAGYKKPRYLPLRVRSAEERLRQDSQARTQSNKSSPR